MTRPRSRGNGEGTIIERADGRIVVRLFVDGHRIERTARTKADGKVLLKAMLDRKAAGLALDADHLSVGAYLLQWLETARPNVRPKTWERYEQIVRLDATPALGHVPLMKLGPHHLQGLYARRLDAGRSPTTVHHLHRVLHRALRQAERWGLVGRNPVALVDAPRRAKPEMRALVPEEAQRLLDAADGDRLEALFVLAITTGMRQGELFGLRWADVDLDAATLSVRQAVQWLKGGPVCTQPKTARSRRSISLTRRAIAALRQHRVRQAEERLKIGQAWRDGGLVFTNIVGGPLEPHNVVRRSFQPVLARSGLPRVRFHDMRHTAATILLAQGVHPNLVSEMLACPSISLTLDTYSHVIPTMHAAAADAMDAALDKRSS